MSSLAQMLQQLYGAMKIPRNTRKPYGGRGPSPRNEAIIEWMNARKASATMGEIVAAFPDEAEEAITYAVYYLTHKGRLVNEVPRGGKRVSRYRLP